MNYCGALVKLNYKEVQYPMRAPKATPPDIQKVRSGARVGLEAERLAIIFEQLTSVSIGARFNFYSFTQSQVKYLQYLQYLMRARLLRVKSPGAVTCSN